MPANPASHMHEPVVLESLLLLQRLLTPERTRTELVSGRPIFSAEALGARVVVGMKTVAPKTWISVYVYQTWNQATTGLRMATGMLGNADNQWTISSVNGRMVLIGRGSSTQTTAAFTRYTLNNILSAFDDEC